MHAIVISFLASLIITAWIIRNDHLHSKFSSDFDLSGIQKFHTKAVPRIGGVGILFGLVISLTLYRFKNGVVGNFELILFASSLPVFFGGFLEDVTKKIGVQFRLLAGFIAAGIAGYLLGGWLTSLQILGLDNLMMTYPMIAMGITCFAVAGVTNAFNIIDGFHGLSSMVAVIILCSIAYVAFQVQDYAIMNAALAMIGAILGFLFWNYPKGLIFLGDGGAYLIGFWIAELSILLTARQTEISKWFPLLLCIYPIFETIFTIYRRVILKRTHPGMPDACHLHQLIYRRVVRWNDSSKNSHTQVYRNAMTAPYLWLLCLMSAIPAILFWRNHLALKGFAVLFGIIYCWLYWMIVRFKVPSFLINRKN